MSGTHDIIIRLLSQINLNLFLTIFSLENDLSGESLHIGRATPIFIMLNKLEKTLFNPLSKKEL